MMDKRYYLDILIIPTKPSTLAIRENDSKDIWKDLLQKGK
jgi:hypothetical protein